MGPEVAGDEVVQAEPSWEAAGWRLHAWVKVGRLRVCEWLLRLSSVTVLTTKGHISFLFFLVLQRR